MIPVPSARSIHRSTLAGLVMLALAASVLVAGPAQAVPFALQNATATCSQTGFVVASAIDGNAATGWSIFCGGGTVAETAVFETTVDVAGGGALSFTLLQSSVAAPGHTLGRFRLSATDDPRSAFADGLQDGGDVTANWTVLDPYLATTSNGSTLTEQPDGSLLASGPNPNSNGESYTVLTASPLATITGFRIEVMEDASLPDSGPGRAGNGNLMLAELTVDTGCTVVGTAGPDNLVGTKSADVICALGDKDSLTGLEGNDVLIGGDGNDALAGGRGDDVLDGGTGSDVAVFYDSGVASGVTVDLTLATDQATNATLGTDDIALEAGLTTIEKIDGSPHADDITGDAQANILDGRGGGDTIRGGGGNDTIIGGAGVDDLFGDAGNDAIQPGAGADDADGGADSDTLKYNDVAGGVRVNLQTQRSTDDASIAGFENVTGGPGNDELVAAAGSSTVNGILGDDRLFANDNDALDTVNGGGGTDMCVRDATDAAAVACESSTPLTLLGSFSPGLGTIVGLAYDDVAGTLFLYDDFANPVDINEITTTGVAVDTISAPAGVSSNDMDLDFTDAALTVDGTNVPANTLLMCDGETEPDDLYGIDKTNGNVLDSRTLVGAPATNDQTVGCAHHADRGTVFTAAHDSEKIREWDAAAGTLLATFDPDPAGSPSFTINFGDVEVAPNGSDILVVSSDQAQVRQMTPTGTFLADYDVAGLGVSGMSGIAVNSATGELWITNTTGTIFHVGGLPAAIP